MPKFAYSAIDASGAEIEGTTKADTVGNARTMLVEQNLFPMLRASCSPEALDRLGDKVRQAKKTAPTRPHPSAPDKPPANKLLAPGAGMVDRVRDALSGRGKLG